MEMFLRDAYLVTLRWCLLHACGDVSPLDSADADLIWSAPRMWRCFHRCALCQYQGDVCSTHVEMFLAQTGSMSAVSCLLHACGDVSSSLSVSPNWITSAPRMWRCFHTPLRPVHLQGVCSTHVEMFLALIACVSYDTCLLHACGDVSIWLQWTSLRTMSAPRMWRCFLLCPHHSYP